jgi:hypothetical protein
MIGFTDFIESYGCIGFKRFCCCVFVVVDPCVRCTQHSPGKSSFQSPHSPCFHLSYHILNSCGLCKVIEFNCKKRKLQHSKFETN